MMNCVAGSRDLTKGVMHELHATLTRHQENTSAIDQFGNRFEIPLLKGKFKEQPNNPKRPDGILHEYCPPVHHIGRELTGIMEATAFAKLESFEDSEDRESFSQAFLLSSTEPFVFTHNTNGDEIANSFARWLDSALNAS